MEANSRNLNSRSKSRSSKSRGHVEADLSLQEFDTSEDYKSYALKSLEELKPELPK
jgi:hypothetical protein